MGGGVDRLLGRGYLTLGRVRGVPVRMHWTTPVGAFVLGRLAFVPGFWVGFLALVLVHELGHAMIVWRCRAQVMSIDLLPYGGVCRWHGEVRDTQRAAIAWGGVLAQAVLLLLTFVVLRWVEPTSAFGLDLAGAFTATNLWGIGVNLLPVRPLDGAEAWPLLGMVWRDWRRPRRERALRSAKEKVRRERLEAWAEQLDRTTDDIDPSTARALDEAMRRIFKSSSERSLRS
jgi:Zn-dependent protease